MYIYKYSILNLTIATSVTLYSAQQLTSISTITKNFL